MVKQHLTLEEKLDKVTTRTSIPRLGMPMLSCYEGLHGLALGGPAHNNGRRTENGKEVANDLPTTIFPQAYGMGCTWDREAIRRIGDIEAEEARWYVKQPEARRKGLVIYAPDNQMGRAEDIAKKADMVIVCTGNHPYGTKTDWKFCPVPSDGREANDRHSLLLPGEDELRRLYAVNPRTVLVLVSSFPYAVNWSHSHLPAILHVTHCSQEQGHGVADILFGNQNPAGRTTQTWVKDVLDLPHMMDYDIRHGRTYI